MTDDLSGPGDADGSDDPDGTRPVRGFASLLTDRTFGPYFLGRVASTSAMWLQNLTAAVLMYDLTESAFMVGLVSAMQFVPILLFSFVAGVMVDQFDRRKLLLFGRLVSTAAVGALALLLWWHGPDGFGGPWVLVAVTFVVGTGWAFTNPAVQALIPALVPRRDLEQALALDGVVPPLARTLGPAIGAGLLLTGGPALAFTVATGGHAAFVLVLTFLRARPQAKPETRPDMLGGWHYLREDTRTRSLILGVGLLSFGSDAVSTLAPPLAAGMDGGGEVVGLFVTAFGVGAIVYAALFRLLRRRLSLRSVSVLGYGILAVGTLLLAFATTPPTGIVAFLVIGLGFMMGSIVVTTRVQLRIPDEVRGRVMALWGLAFLGSRPLAALINGFLADTIGIRVTLLLVTAIVVASIPLVRAPDDDGGSTVTS